jgi:hypothetical protein
MPVAYTPGLSLALPADPALEGLSLVLQGVVVPTATPPLGADFTNGVWLTCGL